MNLVGINIYMRSYYLTIILFLYIGLTFGYSQNKELDIEETQPCLYQYDSLHQRTIYYLVDQMPVYPGGELAMLNTIMRHSKYPGPLCCITGRVVVSIIVEKDGSVSDRKTVRGFGSGACSPDKGIMEALSCLENWQAGRCNGELVAVRVLLPIQICLK